MSDVTSATEHLLREIRREVREGLHTMRLRDEQREVSYQSMIQTLTRQMVEMGTAVEVRLAEFEERMGARLTEFEKRMEVRLDRIEGLLTTKKEDTL